MKYVQSRDDLITIEAMHGYNPNNDTFSVAAYTSRTTYLNDHEDRVERTLSYESAWVFDVPCNGVAMTHKALNGAFMKQAAAVQLAMIDEAGDAARGHTFIAIYDTEKAFEMRDRSRARLDGEEAEQADG